MENKTTKVGHKVLYSGLFWAIIYISCLLLVKEMEHSKFLGIVVSFIPTICFSIFIYYYVKGIGVMDELECRIQLEAAVIGFTLTILLLMTLGLLDLVIVLKKEDWGYRHLIPFLVSFYFFGLFISKRKYL